MTPFQLVSMSPPRSLTDRNRSVYSNASSPEHPRLQLLPLLLHQHPRLRHVERGHGRQVPGPRFTRTDWDQLLGSYSAVSADPPAVAFAEDLITA